MAPEPIPLRTLTVLLNYERMISDPRFKNVGLVNSSHSRPAIVDAFIRANRSIFRGVPKTHEKTHINLFDPLPEGSESDPAASICKIHPDAVYETKFLSFAQREMIYHETHGHDGCYAAIALYQFFFDLCDPLQQISIQLTNEVYPPYPIPTSSRSINFQELDAYVCRNQYWFTWILARSSSSRSRGRNYILCSILRVLGVASLLPGKDDANHSVLGFANPADRSDPECVLVVDMSRLQYGEAGRGKYGENYFMGTMKEWSGSMKKICGEVRVEGPVSERVRLRPGDGLEDRLMGCAKRAWGRWLKRETEGWCAFCGKPGPKLMRCGACKEKKVSYCCVEHQKSDWKLHKDTCERNRN